MEYKYLLPKTKKNQDTNKESKDINNSFLDA